MLERVYCIVQIEPSKKNYIKRKALDDFRAVSIFSGEQISIILCL